jgi:hypothetical protein
VRVVDPAPVGNTHIQNLKTLPLNTRDGGKTEIQILRCVGTTPMDFLITRATAFSLGCRDSCCWAENCPKRKALSFTGRLPMETAVMSLILASLTLISAFNFFFFFFFFRKRNMKYCFKRHGRFGFMVPCGKRGLCGLQIAIYCGYQGICLPLCCPLNLVRNNSKYFEDLLVFQGTCFQLISPRPLESHILLFPR